MQTRINVLSTTQAPCNVQSYLCCPATEIPTGSLKKIVDHHSCVFLYFQLIHCVQIRTPCNVQMIVTIKITYIYFFLYKFVFQLPNCFFTGFILFHKIHILSNTDLLNGSRTCLKFLQRQAHRFC